MKTILFAAFAALSLALFSCNDVIFDEIRKEVELEDPDIAGAVNTIVYYKDDLYVQNGDIMKKEAVSETRHGWSSVEKPSTGAKYTYINNIAADGSYLYASAVLVDEDDDEGEQVPQALQLFCYDGSEWKGPVALTNSDGEETDSFALSSMRIFCTNAIAESDRRAYALYDGQIFELSGEESSAVSPTFAGDTTDASTVKYCASFGGTTYFSKYPMTTNEVREGENEKTGAIYYADDDSVFYSTDGSGWTEVEVDVDEILSLAVTKNYLYLGTDDGIAHIPFKTAEGETHVPTNSSADFDTNAASALSSYYKVLSVLAVFPERPESDTPIYGTSDYSGTSSSSSVSQKNVGLWAYFAVDGSWNIE